jgi:hypothetical protein
LTLARWLAEQPEARELCEILLGLGGRRVTPPAVVPSDTDKILLCGVVVPAPTTVHPGMAPAHPHANVARLWQHREITGVGIGWALGGDAWHQHTWGMNTAGGVVETTTIHRKYFGMIYRGNEAEGFLAPRGLYPGGIR